MIFNYRNITIELFKIIIITTSKFGGAYLFR